MNKDGVFFIGVDVGSGSVRAALVSKDGHILKTSVKELKTWKPKVGYFEQSSEDIWSCCVAAIKDVVQHVNAQGVKGIGFDATCSLVVLDKKENPLSVSPTNNDEQNVIMWMDHRAESEADLINKTNHDVLKYVGGKVSLEMEMPKIVWLKNNFPERFKKIGHFFDLPDFLTWKATGCLSRSLCSLVCKWNYEVTTSGNFGWSVDFLNKIGLSELIENNFNRIGSTVLVPGDPCGNGLSNESALLLGLPIGTPVATSIIDAHAGGLGMIGTNAEGVDKNMSSRISLICGTSTCHMAVNETAIIVPGVWGPYYSAMVPKLWLNEAGQSASGMLLDYIISSHPKGKELLKILSTGEVRSYLRKLLSKMATEQFIPDVSLLSKDIHIWPDFHGNRSPIADPTMKGMIVGLTVNSSEEELALLYLSTLQALAYGTRYIIDTLVSAGYNPFKSLLICGGLSQDPLFVQIQADSVGLPILKPEESESVLVGAAILGACASKYFVNISDAVNKMGGTAKVISPNLSTKSFHDKKYQVFLRLGKDQLDYRKIMYNL